MRRFLCVLLIVVLLLAVIPYAPLNAAQEQATETPTETPTPTPTNTPVPSLYTLYAVGSIDTSLFSANADSNYSASTDLYVGEASGETARTLIRFYLSSIPPGSTINTVDLFLWQFEDSSDNDRTLRVYRSLTDWVVTEATWNVLSTGVDWVAPGSGDPSSDYYGAVELGSRAFSATEANGEKQWSLSPSQISGMANGDYCNCGFLIQADTEASDSYGFHAFEWSVSGERPLLVVGYDVVPSTETATPTPSMTFTPSAGEYIYELTGGQTFTVQGEMSFGDIFVNVLLLMLVLICVFLFAYEVVTRWQ